MEAVVPLSALRGDDRPVLDIGLARRALRVREPDHTEFDGRDGRRSAQKTVSSPHACTNGPGNFGYRFLIASSAQFVGAPVTL
jgi:hypothetical protein